MCASLGSTAWRGCRVAILVLVCSTLAAAAATKNVLVLQSFPRGFEPHSALSALFQRRLAEQSPDPVEFFEVSLWPTLSGGLATEPAFTAYLESFAAGRRLDLVVVIGGPATRFMLERREQLFPGVASLILGTEKRHFDDAQLSEDDAAVPIQVDFVAVLENLLAVLPETTDIVVVLGATSLEQYWVEQIKRDTQVIARRVKISYLNSLPFSQVLARVAASPPRTAIFFPLLLTDAAGVPLRDDSALIALREATQNPILGLFDLQLGRGIVGGPLISMDKVSRDGVGAALKILQGESPARFQLAPIGPGVPEYDARELARLHIDESRLPAGSAVLFLEPTLWQKHKWRMIGVAAFCAGQTVLIVALLVVQHRRRAADNAVRTLSQRLVAAQEEERTRLARELHDDVTQRLARLAIDVGRIEQGSSEIPGRQMVRDVREGLARLSDDVHALAYRLHPSLLEDLGLAEALQAEIERFADQASIPVELAASDFPRAIPNDVSLCLFRVAQEALRNIERHAQARSVKVSLQGVDGGILLTIQDDGVGVDVSRAQSRPSLGIASMRERVHIFAGEFEFGSRPGQGTTVRAFIPLREGRA